MKGQKRHNLKKRRRRSNDQYEVRKARNLANKLSKAKTELAEGYEIIERSYGFGLYCKMPDTLGRMVNKKIDGYNTYQEAVEASHTHFRQVIGLA